MHKRWKYKVMHIPLQGSCHCARKDSYIQERETATSFTVQDFLSVLNEWNCSGSGHWVYWCTDARGWHLLS